MFATKQIRQREDSYNNYSKNLNNLEYLEY